MASHNNKYLLTNRRLKELMDLIRDEPVPRSVVCKHFNWQDATINTNILKARLQGCDIWVIHRGGDHEVTYWLKSGPDIVIPPHPKDEIRAILSNNVGEEFTRNELADLLELSNEQVGRWIRDLKREGCPIVTTNVDYKTTSDMWWDAKCVGILEDLEMSKRKIFD